MSQNSISKEERKKLLQLPFRMTIEDIFTIKGRDVIAVTGRAASGQLRKGDAVHIVEGGISKVVAAQVFGFGGFIHDSEHYVAQTGENVVLLFKELRLEQLKIGMVVSTEAIV